MNFACVNIRKKIGNREILKNVNIEASSGKVTSLLGPNGAGKTTCFSILCGLLKPDSGTVTFNGHDITSLPMYKRARLGLGYLPQEPSIFRGLTVEENILAVLELRHIDKKGQKEKLDALLQEFSLNDIRKANAITLSGGERRRLEIARALANNPKFIMLDEPFAGIDPIAISNMQQVIGYLKSKGIGIVITDHNVRDTLPIADYSYILYDGKILAQGTTEEITKNPHAISKYFGREL